MACSLLLLNGSSTVWAASKKPSGKPVAARSAKASPHKKAGKALRHKARKASVRQSVASEVVAAEIIDSDTVGLHGSASFYGMGFHGRRTSTGERFDIREFSAASNHFPLGSMVAVRRLDNERCAIVKINDRMHSKHVRRIIDVSRSVAEYLDMVRAGVVLVRVAALKSGWRQRGLGACHEAFEAEAACTDCTQQPRLKAFDGEN
ncbi:MAG: septal ring lytic transglycosylase RlpA family protein [Rhodocyclales bacterium GT-UBC]|nr:MAG: septal ring lytic transglycosylase RlpA family protein [Rhodocyclales bacterium GT-UBC]